MGHHMPIKGNDKLLFLFTVRTMPELTYYQNSLKTIDRFNTPYDVLIFTIDEMIRRLPVHHPNHQIIIKKDLGILEVPNKEMEIKLGRQSYKGIINTYDEFLPVLDFVAATIPSKVRITKYRETNCRCITCK